MKIPGPIFRWIEYELYSLDWHKEELAQLKDEILQSSPDHFSRVIGAGHISDQTGDKVTKLMSNPRIKNLERKIGIIERVISLPKFRLIYEYKYLRGYEVSVTCKSMNIEMGKYYRLRRELIRKIAEGLGEVGKE